MIFFSPVPFVIFDQFPSALSLGLYIHPHDLDFNRVRLTRPAAGRPPEVLSFSIGLPVGDRPIEPICTQHGAAEPLPTKTVSTSSSFFKYFISNAQQKRVCMVLCES